METTLKIDLPEDFNMLCDIFSIKPEAFIKKVVDAVSLPHFYCHPHDKSRWATLLFLDHLDTYEKTETEFRFHEPYMEKLYLSIREILQQSEDDYDKAEKNARKVMLDWHRAVLNEKAKYIIDHLENEN